jgi:phosphoglucomutase
MKSIMTHFRNHPPVISGKALISVEDFESGVKTSGTKESKLDLPSSNVIKYIYEGHTWIVFRPSGTEPKIKIYFQTVEKSLQEGKDFIQDVLKNLLNEIEQI